MKDLIYRKEVILPLFLTLGTINLMAANSLKIKASYLDRDFFQTSVNSEIELDSMHKTSIYNLGNSKNLQIIPYVLIDKNKKFVLEKKENLEKKLVSDKANFETVLDKTISKNLDLIPYEIVSEEKPLNPNLSLQKISEKSVSNEVIHSTYTVILGDNLSKIGSKYNISWVEIAKANNVTEGSYNTIYPGQILVIPKVISESKTSSNSKLEQIIDIKKTQVDQNKFISKNYEHNWNVINKKSGTEIWELRKKIGPEGVSNLIGVSSGKCVPAHEERLENIRSKYSIIEEKAKQFGLLPEVLAAVIKIESGGNSKCVSETGALGIMGLTKGIYDSQNRKWHDGKTRNSINPFNDEAAIERGADLLANLLKKYKGNYHYALSAYNQGEQQVDLAIATAKELNINNSFETVSNYLPTDEGRVFSQKVLNLTKVIKKDRQSYLLAMNN